MKKYSAQELVSSSQRDEQKNKKLYAEQRNNIQLKLGNHYLKDTIKRLRTLNYDKNVSSSTQLRLVQNHVGKISRLLTGLVISEKANINISAKNHDDPSNQKVAEMNHSVWQDVHERARLDSKFAKFADDFSTIGECFCKVSWDNSKGKAVPGAIVNEINPATGEIVDQYQEMIVPGDLVFERILAPDVSEDTAAKEWEEGRYVTIKKMIDTEELRLKYKEDNNKLGFIKSTQDDTFTVFNNTTGSMETTKDKTLVRERYYRPCLDLPEGYFYIFTADGILEEGTLPLGLFPLFYAGWDEEQTTARSYGPIKIIRPVQGEVNRCVSSIGTQQITLGDDKVIIHAGSKMAPGGVLNGVRALTVNSGMSPTIIPGRNGAQYLEYLLFQIDQMYKLSNLYEMDVNKDAGQVDLYAALFRRVRDKKKFSMYFDKFERFIKEIVAASLKLHKANVIDQALIPMVGKSEIINIPEYKSTEDICYQIKVEPIAEDVESSFAKQIALEKFLQYGGTNLQPEDLALMYRNMPCPFKGSEDLFSGALQDFENAKNLILALDRGQDMPINKYDDPAYMVKRLISRVRKPDFIVMHPQIHDMYAMKIQQYEELAAQLIMENKQANSDLIPTGGVLAKCDFYVTVPTADGGTTSKRAELPMDSLTWLMERIEKQGFSQAQLNMLQDKAQIEINQMSQQNPSNLTGPQA